MASCLSHLYNASLPSIANNSTAANAGSAMNDPTATIRKLLNNTTVMIWMAAGHIIGAALLVLSSIVLRLYRIRIARRTLSVPRDIKGESGLTSEKGV